MRSSACPVCDKAIRSELVDDLRPFNCPHCDELLRAIRRPGHTGLGIGHSVLLLVALTYGLGFTMELALAFAAGLMVAVVNVVWNRIVGFELEPVGRIPLGGLND